MNTACPDVAVLETAARDPGGRPGPTGDPALRDHLSSCAQCRQLLDDIRQAIAKLSE